MLRVFVVRVADKRVPKVVHRRAGVFIVYQTRHSTKEVITGPSYSRYARGLVKRVGRKAAKKLCFGAINNTAVQWYVTNLVTQSSSGPSIYCNPVIFLFCSYMVSNFELFFFCRPSRAAILCVLLGVITRSNLFFHSILLPSLSFHLAINVLLGNSKGLMTLRVTSIPATGRPEGSRRPSCQEFQLCITIIDEVITWTRTDA